MDNDEQLADFRGFLICCRNNGVVRAKMGDFEVLLAQVPSESAERDEKPSKEQIAEQELDIQYAGTGIVPVNLRALREVKRR
jgi:hypothetical protein